MAVMSAMKGNCPEHGGFYGHCVLCGLIGISSVPANPAPTTSEGLKYDNDKPRVDLLDPLALEGLAAVLAFGARKYAAHNWRGGISYCRLIAALLRHTFAIIRGQDIDAESGLPHVDHLGCCWMFLSNMMKTRPDLDDRYKSGDKKNV